MYIYVEAQDGLQSKTRSVTNEIEGIECRESYYRIAILHMVSSNFLLNVKGLDKIPGKEADIK